MSSWSFGQRVIKNHTITVTQTGTNRTDAFSDGVTYVRVTSNTTEVFVDFGKATTSAVTTGIRLVANEPKTFKVDNADKMSCIAASGSPKVYIEELSE
jgi:hypothetical protein|tara:strand:+ start:115 stop:408 length:294 start_codon:yes stop_codon:yes gene_type:complete